MFSRYENQTDPIAFPHYEKQIDLMRKQPFSSMENSGQDITDVAQAYYGDAARWDIIAYANGIFDPDEYHLDFFIIPNKKIINDLEGLL